MSFVVLFMNLHIDASLCGLRDRDGLGHFIANDLANAFLPEVLTSSLVSSMTNYF